MNNKENPVNQEIRKKMCPGAESKEHTVTATGHDLCYIT
jgi:hypothetical protein